MIKKNLSSLIVMPIYFCISLNVLAYTGKDIRLSDHEFKKYVITQLKSIRYDYNQILSSLNPQSKNTKEQLNRAYQLRKESKVFEKFCLTNKDDELCGKTAIRIKDIIFNFNKDYDQKTSRLSSFSPKLHFKNQLELLRNQIYGDFFHYSLFISEKPFSEAKLKLSLQRVKDFEFVYTNYLVSSSHYSRFLLDLWTNLISPSQRFVVESYSKKTFKKLIPQFNATVNYLVVNMTKRKKDLPENAVRSAKTLHRRWNSILKVSLY